MKILKEIFKRPITISLIVLIVIALGIFSASQMPINLLPDITFPYLSVQTVYVGADAETIEKDVTTPMEKSLSSVPGLRSISTYSIDNASIILLQFEYGTNLESVSKTVNECIESTSLPSGTKDPVIKDIDLNSESIFKLTVYSKTESIDTVYKKALEIKSQLEAIDGVEKAELTGNPSSEIRVDMINGLEPFAALIVQELVKNSSYDIPLGDISSTNGSISINNQSKIKSIEELKNFSIGHELSDEYRAMFSSIRELIDKASTISSSEMLELYNQADKARIVISLLDSRSIDYLENMYTGILNTRNLSSLLTPEQKEDLSNFYDSSIKPLLDDTSFKERSDLELETISSFSNVQLSLLKWVRDNYETAEKSFKEFTTYSQYENMSIDGLRSYIEARKNGSEIDGDIYLSLIGNQEGLNLTSKMVEYILSNSFESDINKLYTYKKNHEHKESVYDASTSSYSDKLVGDQISTIDLVELINSTSISSIIGINPSVELIDFIKSLDLSSNTVSFKLSEVSNIYVSSEYKTKAYYNSNEAIQIDIYGKSGANATSIGKKSKTIINSFNSMNDNVSAVMLNNQADFINDSLSNALVSLIIGMVLAVMVIYLFLRKVKSSLIIAVSMPLSILSTICCLKLMGITLNMVSVGGLAVGIGMLVDNSIVVLESITTEKKNTDSVLTASIKGVKLVLGSLIGSTITSICVFFPILLIDGLTKEIFRDLSWAVIFSLSFSLIVAITVIPTLFCLFYKNEENVEGKRRTSSLFKRMTDWYSMTLEKLLKRKGITILSSIGIFLLSIGLIFLLNIEFLPSIDQGKIEVTIPYESGDSAAYCQEKTMEAYEYIIEGIENIDSSSSSVGWSGLIQMSQSGVISISLNDKAKKTKEVVEDIRELLNDKGFNHDFSVTEIDGVVATLVGGVSGISISVYGDNLDELKEIANRIEEDVMKKKGIKRASDNMLSGSTSYNVKFDSEKLSKLGIDYETAVYTLRIGLSGYSAMTLEENGQDLSVNIGWADNAIDYYGSIEDVVIGVSSSGNFASLKDCAIIEERNGRNVIRKVDSKDVLVISVEAYGIDTNTASKYLKESTKKICAEYTGVTYEESGVASFLSDAFKGLVIALVISFFLLFGVLAGLFESLKKPIIIIFSFPFAFTGGFIALAISGVGLNVVSFIGLIMLMGVVINNAIVLNERIDQLIKSGLDPKKAVIEGCRQRFRAVLMTTLTTILALIPMALGIGKGAELMQPLGVVAIGGMTIGTCVTLVLIPCVYCFFYKIKYDKKERVFTGEDYLIDSTLEGITNNAH